MPRALTLMRHWPEIFLSSTSAVVALVTVPASHLARSLVPDLYLTRPVGSLCCVG